MTWCQGIYKKVLGSQESCKNKVLGSEESCNNEYSRALTSDKKTPR